MSRCHLRVNSDSDAIRVYSALQGAVINIDIMLALCDIIVMKKRLNIDSDEFLEK